MEHQDAAVEAAFEKAAELLGKPLELPLGRGEPASGEDFRRLATQHAFGDSGQGRVSTPVALHWCQ